MATPAENVILIRVYSTTAPASTTRNWEDLFPRIRLDWLVELIRSPM